MATLDNPMLSVSGEPQAELTGIRRIVVVGRRLSEGYAEIRDRRTDERQDVPVTDVVRVMTGTHG